MQQTKLSIIIPAYNAEAYLRQCVESCLTQDLPQASYEILVVDDGSTDNTLQVARALESGHSCITVLSQANQGVSAARNTGIAHAKGEYTLFVDSDDYLERDSLGKIISHSDANRLDLCLFCINVEDSAHSWTTHRHPFPADGVTSGTDYIIAGGHIGSACMILFRTSLITANGIRFKALKYSEDVLFVTSAMVHAKRVWNIDATPYYYRYNSSSATKEDNNAKRLEATLSVAKMASALQVLSHNDACQGALGAYLRKKANSLVLGSIAGCLRDKDQRGNLPVVVEQAQQLGLFPIHGACLSHKSTILARLLNCNALLKAFRLIATH